MGRLVALLTAAALTLALGSVTAPAEAAKGRTKVTWSFTLSDVDVTVAPTVTYAVNRERRGVKAFLQQSVGGAWTDVTRLKGKGTVTLPLQAMGEHQFRVQIRSKTGGKRKRATNPQTLRVYSGVPLADLARGSTVPGTVTLGGQPFAYEKRVTSSSPVLYQLRSSCSQITLFVGSDESRAYVRAYGGAETGTARIVEEDTFPTAMSFAPRPEAKFILRISNGTGFAYATGFGYCYTPDGTD